MMESKHKFSLLGLFNVIIAIIMLAPLILIILTSFTPTMYYQVPTTEWSLKWYAEILNQSAFIKAFFLSGTLAILAALVSMVVGFLASYAIIRFDFPGKSLLDSFFTLPITIPAVVIGISLLQYFARNGLYNTFFGLLMTHSVVVLPYIIKNCCNSLRTVSRDMELAAMNVGATWYQAFWHVTAPLVKTGLMSGFLFAFLVSFSEVTVTLFITGPSYQTLPIRLFNFMIDINTPLVASISSMLIIISVILMLVLERLIGLKNIVG